MRRVIGAATVRFVAVNLLLYTALCLGIPSVCQSESLPIASNLAEQALLEHSPEPAQPEPPHEEDCFCCCTHLRPQPITRGIEELAPIGEGPRLSPQLKPEQRANSLYHPPRP